MSAISAASVCALTACLPEQLAREIVEMATFSTVMPHPTAKLVKQLRFKERKVDRVESGCISDSWTVYPPFPAYFSITFFPRNPAWIYPGERAMTARTNALLFAPDGDWEDAEVDSDEYDEDDDDDIIRYVA